MQQVRQTLVILLILVSTMVGTALGRIAFATIQEAYNTSADAYLRTLETDIAVLELEDRVSALEDRYGI